VTFLDVVSAAKRRAESAELTPFLGDLSLLVDYIRRRYMKVLDDYPWSFLRQDKEFQTVAPYNTGTVTTTQGSAVVVGSGTSWTSSMVGMAFLVGNAPPLRVASVQNATQLTLEDVWPTTGLAAGSGYSIAQDRYTIAPTGVPVKTILHLWNGFWQLRKVNVGHIRRADPQMSSLTTPRWYGQDAQNTVVLWPYPDQIYLHRVIYLQDVTAGFPAPLTLDTALTWGLGDPWFLVDGLLADLYLLGYQRTGAVHFNTLHQVMEGKVEELIRSLDDRDYANRYVPLDVRALPFSDAIPGDYETPFLNADQWQRVGW